MNKISIERRTFLKSSALAFWLLPFLRPGGITEAAKLDGGYKALVVVLLEGGADVFNMIAPNDGAYEDYARARGALALPKESLLDLGDGWGMRENMGAMHSLYTEKKLAIVANVGTLIEPVTAREVEEGSKPVPFELFAHNTQRFQWLSGDATGGSRNGWAARISDRFYAAQAPYFNINCADTDTLLQYGGRSEALHLTRPEISPDTMERYGFGPQSGGAQLGRSYQSLYRRAQSASMPCVAALGRKRMRELTLPDRLEELFEGVSHFEGFDGGVHEVGRPLGRQLELVAQILSVRQNFPGTPTRQIFFVNHHGWDTHDSDNRHQVGYLSRSLGAFYEALAQMGIEREVTTITVSDFGRSLSSNNAGSDHGWGTHAFVMGGSVRGGRIYGSMPILARDSEDFWSDRMVPSTAMESYLATAVRWFGASPEELNAIFPNLSRFDPRNLGFMDRT